MTREIKPIGGYEYVYESSMVWDSEHKKRHKVSKYMGKVMDGDRDTLKYKDLVVFIEK